MALEVAEPCGPPPPSQTQEKRDRTPLQIPGSPRDQATRSGGPVPAGEPRSPLPAVNARARRSSLLWKFGEFPVKAGSPFIPAPCRLIPAGARRLGEQVSAEARAPPPGPRPALRLCPGAQRHLRTDRRARSSRGSGPSADTDSKGRIGWASTQSVRQAQDSRGSEL